MSIRHAIILVALGLVGCRNLNPAARLNLGNGPVVVVSASYIGASASVVADTVAAPIEQQLHGTEGMVWMESESRNDGSYTARLHFEPNTDPQNALALIQKRAALATPLLPLVVQTMGIASKLGEAGDRSKIVIALIDRQQHGWDAHQKWAIEALKRIEADGAIAKAEVFPAEEKQIMCDVDRAKCAELGVRAVGVPQAIQAAGPNATLETLKKTTVVSNRDVKVPLADVTVFREVHAPSAIYRVNLHPAFRITGTPSDGASVSEAASRCAKLALFEKMPTGFIVENLTAK